MRSTIRKVAFWLAPAVFACAASALAQDKPSSYPSRPIRIVITVSPGAGADFMARTVAQLLSERWGQNVVVDSRPGGSGVVAVELVARAAPDGYTVLQYGNAMLLMGAQKRVPFDVLKAFEPVVGISEQPYILLVHPNVPAKTIKELVALSASKPLTYSGGGGVGATVHVGMERLAKITGMKLKYIPYKGSSPAIRALMGGELNLAVGSAMASTAAIRSGKVRGLAVLGAKRIAAAPDLPSLPENGTTGYTLTNQYNWWVPAKTPPAVIAAINRAVTEGMNTPQMVKRLEAEGSEPADRMTPAELKKAVAREYVEIERAVKELNLKLQ
ncbi:MAG TPA: tripartite tricarboxylate transporter substrate binding protein [Burkholderiales bacterium]|nr:tripartite tricarboxylate transporter substrate binding protein [Burkholderiales bacterium]